MKENLLWKITLILSVLGIILASYLLYSYFSPDPYDVCTVNESVNCEAVTKGTLSEIYGIPVSLVGLIGYVVLLCSSAMKKKSLTLAMSAFGMIFCLRITYMELFVEKIMCPVCLACQIIMLFIFLLAYRIIYSTRK